MTLTTRVIAPGGGARIPVQILFRRRRQGGVFVLNGRRILGWLRYDPHHPEPDRKWTVYVSASAFRGTGVADRGDEREVVPMELRGAVGDSHAAGPQRHEPVGHGASRKEAVTVLVAWLTDHRAPALGFGRHPQVSVYVEQQPDRQETA